VTVKVPALLAAPPGVVAASLPLGAPVGTVSVTCVSEFSLKLDAFTPMTVTVVASLKVQPASSIPRTHRFTGGQEASQSSFHTEFHVAG
jgi:hypothetical protein